MAYITMAPFFIPDSSIEELYDCAQLTQTNADGNVVFNSECSGLDENYASTSDEESLWQLTSSNDKFSEKTLITYVAGVNVSNLGLMFRQDMAIATTPENDAFIIDYKYLFSTVLGVVVVLLLVSFCFDVALRSIKLAFLQLVAPIPIISYVDPKSGKDGMFKKWYEMCFKTYISLFIRLLAIYFAAYIISRIDRMVDIVDGSYVSNLLVKIFIIIGALMFAKQLPKILEGLGIKLDGGFTLNPLKKIENEMLGGKQIAKVGRAGLKYTGRAAKGIGSAALVSGAAAVTGQGIRGGGKAFMGAMKGEKFGKNFSNSYKAARDRHREVSDMKDAGVNPWEVRATNIGNVFRGKTAAERVKQVQDGSKSIQSYYDTIKNQAISCDAYDGDVLMRNGRRIESAKTISKELEELKKTQINRSDFDAAKYGGDEAKAEAAYQNALTQQKDRIKEKEADLEFRITALARGDVKAKTASGVEVQSATRVINDATQMMMKTRDSVNKTATKLDSEFVEISGGDDVVAIMKSSKGASAQASSGKMQHITDVGNYTKSKKQ